MRLSSRDENQPQLALELSDGSTPMIYSGVPTLTPGSARSFVRLSDPPHQENRTEKEHKSQHCI